MADSYRAVRQFERMLIEFFNQEHLGDSDSKRYREHMRQISDLQSPNSRIDETKDRLIGTFVYDNDKQTVIFERDKNETN